MKRVSAIGVLLLAFLVAGCASVAGPARSVTDARTSPEAPAETATRSVFIVGDSNSTGFRGTLDVGLQAGEAWAAALPSNFFSPVRGWARDGATTAEMRDAIAGGRHRADVLLIMGGTNDLAVDVAVDDIVENVSVIVDSVGASTVVLLAIAPFDALAQEAAALNRAFEAVAFENGWEFLDPWATMRHADGTWTAISSIDGVHATSEGYAAAGEAIARHLEEHR